MNIEIKKLTREIYWTIGIIVFAVLVLFWFFSRSFATLSISPSEATVTIDNAPVQLSSAGIAHKNLTPGLHNVSVQAEGYIGVSQDIDFSRGFMKTIKITLKSMPNPVKISSSSAFLARGTDFNDSYYLGDDSKTIYKMKVGTADDGTVSILDNKPITEAKLGDITEIIWSPSKDLALFRKLNKIDLFDFMKYDFVNQTEIGWGSTDIGSIAWSPDNSKIAYYYAPGSGERSLIFANVTNTNVERVANFKELGIENPLLRWSPDSRWLLVIPRNKNTAENKIYLFDAYSRTIKTLTDGGNQLDANFSPDSNKIVYSSYSKDASGSVNSIVSIMNADGSNQRSLDLRASLNKIVWMKDARYIIVAAPDAATHKESIFKFDTEGKETAGFIVPAIGNVYVTSLAISDDGKIVLYQSASNIYALKVE